MCYVTNYPGGMMFWTIFFLTSIIHHSDATIGNINGTAGVREVATTTSYIFAQKSKTYGLGRSNNSSASTSISTKSVTSLPKGSLNYSNKTSVDISPLIDSTRKDNEKGDISIRTIVPESRKVEVRTINAIQANLIKNVTNSTLKLGEANSNGATIAIIVIVIIVILIICAVIFCKRPDIILRFLRYHL